MLNNELSSKRSKIIGVLSLLCVFVSLFFFLNYDTQLNEPPKGIHFMRQSDGLSFATNYAKESNALWQPELYNLKNKEAKAACEFPIVYYVAGMQMKFYGKNFYILKALHLFIAWGALLVLFWNLFRFKRNLISASVVVLIPFTSAVFNYYSLNYLPDIAALGFTMAALGLVYSYSHFPSNRKLIFIVCLFALASLLKVTYFIYPFGLILSFFIARFYSKSFNEKYKAVTKSLLIAFAVLGALVFLWNAYMISYNTYYESSSFHTSILPIWDAGREKVLEVFDYMWGFWYSSYFAQTIFHLALVLLIVLVVFIKRTSFFSKALFVLFSLGGVMYALLFYTQFKDHDYYFLVFIPIYMLLYFLGLQLLVKLIKRNYMKIVLGAAMLVVLFTSVNHARLKINKRYSQMADQYDYSSLILNDKATLLKKNLKLKHEDKVLVYPDDSQNGSLLSLDKKGWLLPYHKSPNTHVLKEFAKRGASYFFYVKIDSLNDVELIDAVYPVIFEDEELKVYSLKN